MGKLSGKPVTPLYIYLSKSLSRGSKAYYKIGVAIARILLERSIWLTGWLTIWKHSARFSFRIVKIIFLFTKWPIPLFSVWCGTFFAWLFSTKSSIFCSSSVSKKSLVEGRGDGGGQVRDLCKHGQTFSTLVHLWCVCQRVLFLQYTNDSISLIATK